MSQNKFDPKRYEVPSSFYLGAEKEINSKEESSKPYLYDAKDLCTHGTILGMTGSGKTGLAISILEEAALDGIPSIIIDPKGDMANLMLSFNPLNAENFKKWVHPEKAQEKGLSVEDYAAEEAQTWKNGIESWGQDEKRIQALQSKIDFNLYTPGSDHGVGVSILSFLQAPSDAELKSQVTFQEKIESAASSLCELLEINSDPKTSREHSFMSSIFKYYWSKKVDMNLYQFMDAIEKPPFSKIGVLSLDRFFPEKKREALLMQMNTLLASPSFESWIQGVPLNIENAFFGKNGKAQVTIFNIAHLDDKWRMFFVSQLLSSILSWMRTQKGTSSLRSLVYMDEVYGYFPPSSNPPSKKPMLTLLKQARAFGLGILLSSQNPVDLDYKALSNMGTWFLGKLQTEQDQNRVIQGLEISGDAIDKASIRQYLSSVEGRNFLVKNVHDKKLSALEVRWVLSYLRGPMNRDEISQLCEKTKLKIKKKREKNSSVKATKKSNSSTAIPSSKEIKSLYCPLNAEVSEQLVYRPHLSLFTELFIEDTKSKLREKIKLNYHFPLSKNTQELNWKKAILSKAEKSYFQKTASSPEAVLSPLPTSVYEEKWRKKQEKEAVSYLYTEAELPMFYCPEFKTYSAFNEAEDAFRARLSTLSSDDREEEKTALRKKYQKKLESIEKKIIKAEAQLGKEKTQASRAKLESAMSIGLNLLGSFMGRKKVGRSTLTRGMTSMRSVGRAREQGADVHRAEDKIVLLQEDFKNLEKELENELSELTTKLDPKKIKVEKYRPRLLKKNIQVKSLHLTWLPYEKVSDFEMQPVGKI